MRLNSFHDTCLHFPKKHILLYFVLYFCTHCIIWKYNAESHCDSFLWFRCKFLSSCYLYCFNVLFIVGHKFKPSHLGFLGPSLCFCCPGDSGIVSICTLVLAFEMHGTFGPLHGADASSGSFLLASTSMMHWLLILYDRWSQSFSTRAKCVAHNMNVPGKNIPASELKKKNAKNGKLSFWDVLGVLAVYR